jgi:hypothetical protein
MAAANHANGQPFGAHRADPLHARRFNDNNVGGRTPASGESLRIEQRLHPLVPGAEKAVRLTSPEAPKPDVSKVGRRSAPRLRLSLPGQLVAVERVHRCILLNLSRTGAQVAILEALREGEGAILRCGVIDHFAVVTRSEFGLNALQFDEPLTDAQVIDIRHYHENFEERERRALIETARKWVNGESDDDRAI